MSSLHTIFIRPATKPQVHTPQGIHLVLNRFSARVATHDPLLAQDLADKGLESTFFAFRWFTCLAPGGMGLPDTIRLWDSLFADWCLERDTRHGREEDGFRFLEDFAVAVLLYAVTLGAGADGRSHREKLLAGGFSENITLLQRRPVDDLALTLTLAYSLREERVTNSLNEENEIAEVLNASSPRRFKFDAINDEIAYPPRNLLSLRRTSPALPTPSPPPSNGTRWGTVFFKANSSHTSLPRQPPSTPPSPPSPQPAKFSPGAWGAHLSRKLTAVKVSPETSPKSILALDDRTSFSARAAAVVRGGIERRGEIIAKVGGWVANTHDGEGDVEEEGRPREEVSPEEYIARIKKRRERRDGSKRGEDSG
jgi:Rab-GTPase-TBC domain